MALWLQRQEAIHHKTTYHAWKKLKKSAPSMDAIHRSLGSEGHSDMGNHLGEGAGDGAIHAAPQQLPGMLSLLHPQ